jgi:2-polyprenyl-3-methyl-5-hydroxy-6-metoxy-1,4-benzoquinol methylase
VISNRYKNDGRPLLKLSDTQIRIREQYVAKVQAGKYTFESVPCCVCKGNKFELLSKKDGYGIDARIVICRDCGLIQLNPRMTQDSYAGFYNEEYRLLHSGEAAGENLFQFEYKKGKSIYDWLTQNVTLPKPLSELSVLEVGCAVGGILQYFKDQGSRVKGLDLDEEAVKFGRERHGLDLTVGEIQDVDYQPDVIIYADALEHMLQPGEGLLQVGKILSPGGFVYIGVPGLKKLLKESRDFLALLQVAHTYYFSLRALTNLVEASGFELVTGNESINSVFKKTSRGKLLTNDYYDMRKYISQQERYRSFFFFSSRLLKFTRLYRPASYIYLRLSRVK